MEPTAVSPFAAWENFYVIVGSSAAALTGLQFVVVVLGAEARSIGPEVGAFGTPTVVHFCAALLISAILSVPWRAVSNAGLALDAVGMAGILYMAVVIRRALRPLRYVPVLEDWLWHCAFPLVAYVTLLVAAVVLQRDPPRTLLLIGATATINTDGSTTPALYKVAITATSPATTITQSQNLTVLSVTAQFTITVQTAVAPSSAAGPPWSTVSAAVTVTTRSVSTSAGLTRSGTFPA